MEEQEERDKTLFVIGVLVCAGIVIWTILLVTNSGWIRVTEQVKGIALSGDAGFVIETDKQTYSFRDDEVDVIRTKQGDKKDIFQYKRKDKRMKDKKVYVSDGRVKEVSKEFTEKTEKTLWVGEDE